MWAKLWELNIPRLLFSLPVPRAHTLFSSSHSQPPFPCHAVSKISAGFSFRRLSFNSIFSERFFKQGHVNLIFFLLYFLLPLDTFCWIQDAALSELCFHKLISLTDDENGIPRDVNCTGSDSDRMNAVANGYENSNGQPTGSWHSRMHSDYNRILILQSLLWMNLTPLVCNLLRPYEMMCLYLMHL